MNISDILYFAPGIPFKDVDWEGGKLPDQFRARIEGFYLEPAECCIETEHAFAAGLLLVSCVDALARLKYKGLGYAGLDESDEKYGWRFKKFSKEELISFQNKEKLSSRFYKEFRNGLVHEARLKEGAQFSLDIGETVHQIGDILLINPRHLITEVRDALDSYVELLKKDKDKRRQLSDFLKQDLDKDIRTVEQYGA